MATPKELLLINEYDKFTPLVENDALSRVGLNQALKLGMNIKSRINRKREHTKTFAQERVFHISQIEGICKKYRLRFLPTRLYRGVIDNELPTRISTFEIAYDIKCNDRNTRIVAPIESFELEKKPKDPLMFYEINDEYFYLIHKWGNDLSLGRAILPLFENSLFCWLSIPLVFSALFLIGFKVGVIATTTSFLVSSFIQITSWAIAEGPMRFLKLNEWNSEYK